MCIMRDRLTERSREVIGAGREKPSHWLKGLGDQLSVEFRSERTECVCASRFPHCITSNDISVYKIYILKLFC